MKVIKDIRNVGLTIAGCLLLAASAFAQETLPTPTATPAEQINSADIKKEPAQNVSDEAKKPENLSIQNQVSDTTTKREVAAQPESPDDETAKVTNYYVNYLTEYRLGPEDVISVDVFGQPNYSKAGINIPPTSTISYQLIPGGVFVGGKTTDQVGKEIAKKLEEYIIDPQVTVTLEKVGSARYAVMGDVGQPGIRLMTRRVTASSALMEAGGVLPTGSRKKAIIYRNNGTGGYSQIAVNLDDVMKGKANDVDLQPGDQLFIPGNKMKTFNNILETVSKASSFRLLFGFPF